MKRNLFVSSAMASALLVGSVGVAQAQSAAGSAQAADNGDQAAQGGIAEIVVTATRRSEKIQKVPITVQAIGGPQLRERGLSDFSQLLAQMPEVHAGGRGPGQNSISIRGLSLAQIGLQGSAVGGPDPNVAVYIDDAAVSLPGRNLDVYTADLERVEVLAGPQGTLFGASAEAGAIRYITEKPNLSKFGAGINASGSVTLGHDTSESVQGYVNLPIVEDKLAVRVTAFLDRQGGYIDNVPSSFQMPLVGHNADGSVSYQLPAGAQRETINNAEFARKDFNPATYAGGRISLKWAPAPDWTVIVEDMYQSLEAEGTFQYDPTLGDLKVARYSPDYNHDKFNQIQWNVEGKLGGLQMIYSGSFLDRRIDQKFDYTQYAAVGPYVPYYVCHYPDYATCASPRMTYLDTEKNTRLTQEFRISTPADKPLRLQAGVYYDNTKIYLTNGFYEEGAIAQGFHGQKPGGIFTVYPGVRPDGVVFFTDALRSESQIAAFGEASWDITPKLTLTAGARYYDQKIGLQGSINCGALGQPTLPNGNLCPKGDFSASLAGKSPAHQHGVTPKITLSYKPQNDVLIYATYSEGFRPGGFNRQGGRGRGFTIPYTYESDGLKNYEIGWKTQWLNRRVQWNGSAYWVDWSRIPVSIYAPQIINSTFVANGPNARVKGITSDLIWMVTNEFTVTGSLTYNDSKLISYGLTPAAFQPKPGDSPKALTLVDLGSPLAISPKWQGSIGLRYNHELTSGSSIFAELNTRFTSSSITQTIKTYKFNLPGYTMIDASLGMKKDNLTIQAFINNITDKRAQTYASNNDNIDLYSTVRPRTIGVRFGWNY
ncbi:MAG: TonB-dependent receptor [Sphingomonadales bacterium]|nr:TonB-dependent receptor [Sphingomonadales bacterium]